MMSVHMQRAGVRPTDERYMLRAIELERQKRAAPVGTVIADDWTESIVAEGIHRTSDNTLWHGEIAAIASRSAASYHNRPCTLFTTAEPCPLCQAGMLRAGIGRVVSGTSVPTLQRLGWKQFSLRAADVIAAWPRASCELVGGACEAECDSLFAAGSLSPSNRVLSI